MKFIWTIERFFLYYTLLDTIGLHRVENKSHTKPAISLHVYIPPYSNCYIFNENTGQRTQCTLTFDTIDGKSVEPE